MRRRLKTWRNKLQARPNRRKGDNVFLTREFTDLGGADKVLRALSGLVRDGRLDRLGYGVYGRAVQSRLSGQSMLYGPNGFAGAACEALTELGVQWEPAAALVETDWHVIQALAPSRHSRRRDRAQGVDLSPTLPRPCLRGAQREMGWV